MSASGNLPPQAYTREVLVKAYEWLAHQAPDVRDRATTTDSLVALYLQAKRRTPLSDGKSPWEMPTAASVEAFKADLRNLAEGLRQFDDPLATPPPLARETFEMHKPPERTPSSERSEPVEKREEPAKPAPPEEPSRYERRPEHHVDPRDEGHEERRDRPREFRRRETREVIPPPTLPQWQSAPAGKFVGNAGDTGQGEKTVLPDPNIFFHVDTKTRAWVQDVRFRLNLSSDADAMRALVAVGYERLRDLLPRA